jgi:hypothetical protein
MKIKVNFCKIADGDIKVSFEIEEEKEDFLLSNLFWKRLETKYFSLPEEAEEYASEKIDNAQKLFRELTNKRIPENYIVKL